MPAIEYSFDLSDPRLRDYLKLTEVELRKVVEPAEGLYIAESRKVIERAVAAGHIPRSIVCAPEWLDSVLDCVSHLDNLPVFVLEPETLQSLTGYNVHRGALASMHRPVLPSIDKILANAQTIVILEDIVDHTNVGAIFRSVAALGADAVLVTPSCADPLYRRSVRVSMGAVFQVPWTRTGTWEDTKEALARNGFTLAALALKADAVSLRDFADDRPQRVALAFGTEGNGLSSKALAMADVSVVIPMQRGVDSLNVAAASAVALYALC